MFSALDHLNGWQLIGVLLPIVIVMWVVRYREDRANSIAFEKLNSLQQGWIFLSLLAPGLSASLLDKLSDDERRRLLAAGRNLQGSATRASLPVLELFFKSEGEKGAPSKDVHEVCRFLNLKYGAEPTLLLAPYRKAYL